MNRALLTILYLFCVLKAECRHYDLTAQSITTSDGLPTNIVSQIWQTHDGFIWFETRRGLCRYDGYTIQVMGKDETSAPEREKELHTRDAEWLREGTGRLSRHGHDGSIRSWQLIHPDIIAYTRADHFHVADINERTEAISTYGNGLYLYDKPTGELTCIDRDVIDNPYLTGLFVDRTGCIWVVEDYLGIKCLRMNDLHYQRHLFSTDGRMQDANHVRCLAQTGNGHLLCSNQMGDIYEYGISSGQATFLQHGSSKLYAALKDSNGTLWTGTRGTGLMRNGHHVDGLPSEHIYSIAEDGSGGIWVAMYEGGVAHILADGTHILYIKGKKCHDITHDKNGRWWVAAEDSLYIISGKSVKAHAPGYYICLLSDKSGTLWAGGIGCGLLNCHSGERYTTTNGLANDNVYSIVQDRQGMLWVGTEEGLVCFNPQTKDTRNYHFTDSRLANIYSERAAICLPNGQLLFGTHDGIIDIHPKAQKTDPKACRTSITEVLVNGEARVEIGSTEAFSLTYKENNITFGFSNFQYAMLGNVLYQYRLDGIDTDWCQPTKEHTATYTHLPPGRYTFRVRSNDGTGKWREEIVQAIVISQPWWNTWWAWLLYALVTTTLIVIAFFIGRRIMRLHRQVEVERQVSAFKTDFYNRIERELRNPVNVLQGAAENVQLSGTTKTTMQSLRRGSRRMLKLMDMIQQFHKLDEVEMQVKAEHDAMNQEAEQRFRDIQLTIHAEEQEFRELAPPPINRQKVLIMEEDEDNLTHLTDTLNPIFHIIGCATVVECEKLVNEQQPSVLLMDTTAHEKECCDLTHQLHIEHPSLPVIHLSSFHDDTHHLRSLRSGAADYITKPFSGKVLAVRISKHLTAESGKPTSAHPQSFPDAQHPFTDVKDKKFLDRFHALLTQHIADNNFSVEQFAELMHLGRTQFYKRVKALTGETPVQHLHRARLNYAAQLLRESQMTVEEVMMRAGFNSPTHFYNSFKKQFGMSPKELRLS